MADKFAEGSGEQAAVKSGFRKYRHYHGLQDRCELDLKVVSVAMQLGGAQLSPESRLIAVCYGEVILHFTEKFLGETAWLVCPIGETLGAQRALNLEKPREGR
jgi:hypothetical protein